jgi:polyhydroxyalkanoate synthesis regulator phasin
VDLQRELSAAGMRFKIEQRQVTEMLMETLGMPTRTELDDAYRSLYELRREVKALKKALQAKEAPKQKEPAKKAAPVPKAAAK